MALRSRSASTFAGGGGMIWQRSRSRTNLPRRVGDVMVTWALRARIPAIAEQSGARPVGRQCDPMESSSPAGKP